MKPFVVLSQDRIALALSQIYSNTYIVHSTYIYDTYIVKLRVRVRVRVKVKVKSQK